LNAYGRCHAPSQFGLGQFLSQSPGVFFNKDTLLKSAGVDYLPAFHTNIASLIPGLGPRRLSEQPSFATTAAKTQQRNMLQL